jgi:tartrate-resistant acid phosphatase type 5
LTASGVNKSFVIPFVLGCFALDAADTHVYVGALTDSSATVAWGKTKGSGNIIGRGSRPLGRARIDLDGREVRVSDKNWAEIDNLAPDWEYSYTVIIEGGDTIKGKLRTWPLESTKLTFFVIGDYGTGNSAQRRLGRRMASELRGIRPTGPPRFVLTTGDNIYGVQMGFGTFSSGNHDTHWRSRFFTPYESVLQSIPFYPTLGNHDGDESENRDDLDVYMDNFFFPDGKAARYYKFSYGKYADFFALDSTANRGSDYSPDSPQTKWLAKALADSRAPWKIAYFHHPIYTAGPRHAPRLERLSHWVNLFKKHGVQVVLTGHEHNFQFTNQDGIAYFISGSGGTLRESDIGLNMAGAGMEGWSAERQFLIVEMDGDLMRITPMSEEGPVAVQDAQGGQHKLPLTVRRAR